MIIVDFTHVVIANVMQAVAREKNLTIDEGFVRHLVLNALRAFRVKFKGKYGNEMVLCCEGGKSWRYDVFPYYKAKRHLNRSKDTTFDWKAMFAFLDKIGKEIADNFPYKLLKVDRAEADDLIAVITEYKSTEVGFEPNPLFPNEFMPEPILIISGDHDFLALQKYPNVDQYRPVQKDMATTKNPRTTLHEAIIGGCTGDGIPNILSDDDTFAVQGKRQKPMRAENLAKWAKLEDPTKSPDFTDEMRAKYNRNEMLVSFSRIPEELRKQILDAYKAYPEPKRNRNKIWEYLGQNRLRNLVEAIDQF